MAHYRGRRVGERGRVGGGGGWEARGGLNPPLGQFGLAVGPKSASYIGSNMLECIRNVSQSQG